MRTKHTIYNQIMGELNFKQAGKVTFIACTKGYGAFIDAARLVTNSKKIHALLDELASAPRFTDEYLKQHKELTGEDAISSQDNYSNERL